MRRTWKKLVSLVLAASMMTALLPVTALAKGHDFFAEAGHFGNTEDIFEMFLPEEDEEYTEEEMLEYAVVPWEELDAELQPYGRLLRSSNEEAKWQEAENGEWKVGLFADAVNNVYDGGTVELLQDVYLTKTISFNKNITITSADAENPQMLTCAINGHGYLLNITDGTLALENVAVDGGYNEAAEIKIYGQRALIAVNGGNLVLEKGAEIRNNYNATVSGAGGGVCVINGEVAMEDGSSIYGNYACSSGGVAILQESTNVFAMNGGVVENNTAVTMYTNRTYTSGWKYQIRAGGYGGGFGISAGKLVIDGGAIQNNVAQPVELYRINTKDLSATAEWYACQGGYGGGIATYSSSEIEPVVEVTDGEIKANDGFYGGGMYIDWGSVTVEESNICSNTATSKIVRKEDATGGYTEDIYGGHGGGIYLSYGSFTMDDSAVCHNEADYYGGGVYQLQGGINSDNKLSASSDLVIKNSSIIENTAYACGAMYISGSNKSEWNGTGGSWGTTKLIDTEVTKNTAEKKGGGILVAPYQDVTVSGAVKIHNNTAPDHNNFLLDNDVEYNFAPGRVVVEAVLDDDAVIYIDVCEHTEPYEEVKQLVAVGTDSYQITDADFEKFESDNVLYVTLFENNWVYLVSPDHTVTFDSNGGSAVAPVGVMSGDPVPKPTDPTREGYTFAGWYTSTDNGVTLDEAYDFTTPVTESFTLYAKWEAVETEDPDDPDPGDDDDETPDRPSGPSYGKVTLTKVDAEDNDTVLSGVEFALYKESGRLIDVYSTDSDGEITVGGLRPGDYYWVELSPAVGYVLDDTEHAFEIKAHRHTKMTVENERSAVPGYFTDDHYAYIVGYDDGLVHPEWNVTRAEVAAIFFRLLDKETRAAYLSEENHFSDVNEGDWFHTSVSTMAAMGILSGYPDGKFHPSANITRAEFAAIAARFEERGNTTDGNFEDIYGHWAMKEINISANNGWVLGYEDGTFRPDQKITRAEAMAMVNRVLQRIPQDHTDLISGMKMWPDNANMAKWYYLTVQEATNSHDYGRKTSGYEFWTKLNESPNWNEFL